MTNNERVCENCGTPLPHGTTFSTKCGTRVENQNTCKSCGAPQSPDAKFCTNCGVAQNGMSGAPETMPGVSPSPSHSGQMSGGSPEKLKQLFAFEQPARRIELLVRIFYSIAVWILLWAYGIIARICLFIQWFVILILGRRNDGLSDFIKGFLEYYVHVMSYIYWMTDERPGVVPKKVEIYEKRLEP